MTAKREYQRGDIVEATRMFMTFARVVSKGDRGVVAGAEHGWVFVRFERAQVAVIPSEIRLVPQEGNDAATE